MPRLAQGDDCFVANVKHARVDQEASTSERKAVTLRHTIDEPLSQNSRLFLNAASVKGPVVLASPDMMTQALRKHD